MLRRRGRVLVTGPSGLLGAALCDSWADRWDITALAGRNGFSRDGVVNVPFDLAHPDGLTEVVESIGPDVVVHCAAWTDLDACEANPELARVIHRDSTAALAAGAAKVGAAFVYISTDALFSSVPGPHDEDAQTDPRSVYAKTKLEGEEVALAICPKALVVRTCIIGWNALPKISLTEWILRELRSGRPVRGFTDVSFTPILTTTLVSALEHLLSVPASGIIHVGGGECITKHRFAEKVADVFELPRALVIPTSVEAVNFRAPRPAAPCLDSTRYSHLAGRPLQTVDEALTEMRRLEKSGWCDRLRSSVAPVARQ